MAKVLVCGGRDFTDRALLDDMLDFFNVKGRIDCVVHGDQRGADALAKEWALKRGIDHKPYPADWKKHGKSAGPIRNELMLDDNPDIHVVIAFPTGGPGTIGMMNLARKRGIRVNDASNRDNAQYWPAQKKQIED